MSSRAAGRTDEQRADISRARAVADAVLYEGYLLYPYRSTSAKNQVRWQFGVLGPPGAASAGVGEEPDLSVRCLLLPARTGSPTGRVRLHLRFLQLQERHVERAHDTRFLPVPELTIAGQTWLRWDEAAEHEVLLGPVELSGEPHREYPVKVAGAEDIELLPGPDGSAAGRLVRRRQPLSARVSVSVRPVDAAVPEGGTLLRLRVDVRNVTPLPRPDRAAATAGSFLGAHLILVADDATFLSMIDPPDWASEAATACVQRRCWPVLAGGADAAAADIVLASPIILYDHPEVAPESAGALFDSTEIDEILTLRVMTLTDEEKSAARATDPHAAAIIDRCDRLTPPQLQRLHGILRDPRGGGGAFAPYPTGPNGPAAPAGSGDAVPTWSTPVDSSVPVSDVDVPWWDPAADTSVDPATDVVLVHGVEVRRGSLVRLRPNRRADAQDLFFAGQLARVTAVLGDVDGGSHVAVVLVDDPAADLHDWYGRYLYFAPGELEPLPADPTAPDT